jgi:hypothetical protein
VPKLLCLLHVVLLQVAEHKRAVDKMLEEKRARYEEARRAEEAEAAARCACYVQQRLDSWAIGSSDIALTCLTAVTACSQVPVGCSCYSVL